MIKAKPAYAKCPLMNTSWWRAWYNLKLHKTPRIYIKAVSRKVKVNITKARWNWQYFSWFPTTSIKIIFYSKYKNNENNTEILYHTLFSIDSHLQKLQKKFYFHTELEVWVIRTNMVWCAHNSFHKQSPACMKRLPINEYVIRRQNVFH